ncbi:uncharacterized protein PgNI_07046 [Pyricularia grisea]|uniref:Uncharacterized protein n=1 Tax=Pyricularia grisea TaxID=148305 RepID=A0A6P8B0F9_PYRGI|nr:uncharacterized protein PgNI_07046 [Pyricularia grisea]TLD08337.1 hypothetical protein PgNI_07046 [Pyricularia grisea]
MALSLSLCALAVGVLAQSTSSEEIVWSSVAYIYHGERQPLVALGSPVLTPLGAQQMLAQGAYFRARYLSSGTSDSTGSPHRISSLDADSLDSTKISVVSSDDAYVSSSAIAFMQGLYPPVTGTMAGIAGGAAVARLANNSVVEFPLNGYQYPRVQASSMLSSESVWTQGYQDCPSKTHSELDIVRNTEMKKLREDSQSLFNKFRESLLESSGLFKSGSDLAYDYFGNAYDVYDFVRYNYTHDNVTQTIIPRADIDSLEKYAARQQQQLHGNLTVSGTEPNDQIRAIGGKTIATRISSQIRASSNDSISMHSSLQRSKLTLIFGSHEPLISLFSLTGLVNGNSKQVFEALPNPGAAIVFETFTAGGSAPQDGQQPQQEDLLVRFLYRNGSEDSAPFVAYPLFGRSNAEWRMRYTDFMEAMDRIAMPTWQLWCAACGHGATFCPGNKAATSGLDGVSVSVTSSGNMSLAVAGVIGAVSALALMAILTVMVALLGGLRLSRRNQTQAHGPGGFFTSGGFRGEEKRENDRDVQVTQGGIRHERSGSWELRSAGPQNNQQVARGVSPRPGLSVLRQQGESQISGKRGGDVPPLEDETSSIFGASPVEPRSAI